MDEDAAGNTSRRALADFVRAHRLRLTPASAGLVPGTRRRTPGLRREEVAQLSGISATWYTWIEQGREVSASPTALARLSRTLHLSPAERAYLFELAGKRDPALPPSAGATDAPAALVAAVNAIAGPAYVLDRMWRARTWNLAAAALFVGWLDEAGADRNILRYMFLNPVARTLVHGWEERASRLLAEFRLDQGRHLDDPEMNALVADLRRQSPFFATAWGEHIVVGREGGLRTFSHPALGLLYYEQVTFNLSSRPEFKLVMLVAAGSEHPI
ncbi:MAG: family transcriptional regulator [Rhodospirillales bacterium]|nr:family transcriptional regulator [Rhodospirillales bacterium]